MKIIILFHFDEKRLNVVASINLFQDPGQGGEGDEDDDSRVVTE